MRLSLVLVGALAIGTLAATERQAAPTTTASSSGAGFIMGRVIDAGSGAPIVAAMVTINGAVLGRPAPPAGPGASGSGPRSTYTDSQGRFLFRNLPKGTFTFTADGAGYPVSGGGGRGSNTSSVQAATEQWQLQDGERLGNVVIRLSHFAVISGTVLDELGEPAVDVDVHAYRRTLVAGRIRLTSAGVARTDDRGVYRIAGLTPAEYAVGIVNTTATIPLATLDEFRALSSTGGASANDVREALSTSGAPTPTSTGIPVGDIALLRSSLGSNSVLPPPPSADGRVQVYRSLFYPSAAVATDAALVKAGSGEERGGIDLRLQVAPTVKVSGTVMGPQGAVANIGVRLIPAGADSGTDANNAVATTATDANGRFTLLGVTSGQYVVSVQRTPRTTPAAGTGAAAPQRVVIDTGAGSTSAGVAPDDQTYPTLLTPTAPILWAQAPLAIGDRDVSGVELTLRTGFRVSARAEFDGAGDRPSGLQLTQVYLQLEPASGPPATPSAYGQFNAQLQFVSSEVAPGKYFFRTRGSWPGWTLKSAVANGTDMTTVPIDVSRDVADVVVTFTRQPAGIAGTVRSAQGAPATGVAVLLFPIDRARWNDYGVNPRNIRSAKTSVGGTYAFENVPAGDYFAIALPEEPENWAEPAHFEDLSRRATRVRVTDGQTTTADLRTSAVSNGRGSSAPSEVPPRIIDGEGAAPQHGPFVADEPELQVRNAGARSSVGTAFLSGTIVTDDQAGRPVRRATLTLTSQDGLAPRLAVSDDDGRFVFAALPAGRYTLAAEKPSFVPLAYGAKGTARTGTAIALAEAQRLTLALRMLRGAVITGRVLDDAARPTNRVTVLAYQTDRDGRTPYLFSGFTDDRGEYRIFGLVPGNYTVAAVATRSNMTGRSTDAEFRWAEQQWTGRAGAMATPGTSVAPPPPGATVKYAPVYFPGTTDLSTAALVKLVAGEERPGLDFSLQFVRTARIDGVLRDPSGQPSPGAVVSLISPAPFDPVAQRAQGPNDSARTNEDGTFTFLDRMPGRYVMTARAASGTGRGTPSPPPVRGATPPPQDLWALMDVTIGGEDIAGLTLSLQPGMLVAGRVSFDGAAPPQDPSRVRVRLVSSATGGVNVGVAPATVAADGTFAFAGVAPASYRVAASLPADLSATWALKSAVVAGRDALDDPMPIRPGGNVDGLVLTFTDRPTDISGTLFDQQGTPAPGYYVVAFSTNKAFWTQGSRRVVQTRPTNAGKYAIRALPPGEYYLCALTELNAADLADPAFLGQLVSASVKLTLAEGEKKAQDLKLSGSRPHPTW